AVSKYLKTQFSSSTQQLLGAYDRETNPSAELLGAIAAELDQQLSNESLYDMTRFAAVVLKGEVRELIARKATGDEGRRLNRLLLEAAYPDLAKSRGPYEVIVQHGAEAKTE